MRKLLLIEEGCHDNSLEIVDKKNLCLLLSTSKIFFLNKLRNYLMSSLKNSFVSFSKTDTFNAIDYKLFKSIISRSDLNVSTEIEVFNALVSWIEHDEKTRGKFGFDLLKMVRLPLLSSEFIKNVVKKHSLFVNCQNCRDHIDSILVEKSKGTELTLEDFQNENRCCMHESFAFMFYDANSSNKIKRKLWWCGITNNGIKIKTNEIPSGALEFHNTSYCLERCPRFANEYPQFLCKNSDELTKLVSYICNYSSCLFMEKLYILGGSLLCDSSVKSINTCLVFDPNEDKFVEVCRMLKRRAGHSCVVFDGKIVVTGGNGETRSSVEAYDHYLDGWTYMPGMRQRRFLHGSVAMGNKLYVIGGRDTTSCEVFDKVSNKFSKIKQFPLPYK